MNGIIYKIIAGTYTVKTAAGTVEAKARGRFRDDGITPLLGDEVVLQQEANAYRITELLPRRNRLQRPAVANIDRVVYIVSAGYPQPDLLLADNVILWAKSAGIKPLLAVNKSDVDARLANDIADEYRRCGIDAVVLSVKEKAGISELLSLIAGQVCCLAGQSAVGKSSLIAALLPDAGVEIGELSRKVERGRNTTRHSELFALSNGTLIADTPGFSLLDMPLTEPQNIVAMYEEYEPYLNKCRFDGCSHSGEPDCAVRNAVERGVLPRGRYERYCQIYKQEVEKWRKRYD